MQSVVALAGALRPATVRCVGRQVSNRSDIDILIVCRGRRVSDRLVLQWLSEAICKKKDSVGTCD